MKFDGFNNDRKQFMKNNKLMLKTQQRFFEMYNIFTEKIKNTTLGSNNDKNMQSNDRVETYAYETRKDIASEHEQIKYNNIIKQNLNDSQCFKTKLQ